jgi:hypothetical protein
MYDGRFSSSGRAGRDERGRLSVADQSVERRARLAFMSYHVIALSDQEIGKFHSGFRFWNAADRVASLPIQLRTDHINLIREHLTEHERRSSFR